MSSVARRLVAKMIAGLLAFITLFVAWMLFTTSGSKTSLNILQNTFNKLEYVHTSGTLATGLHLENVKWQLENNTVVKARNIEFHWNPLCWRAKQLCISELKSDNIVIDMASDNAEEAVDVKTLSSINLPISIIADSVQIEELVVNNSADSPIIINHVEFSGDLAGSTLTAERMKFDWLWLQAEIDGTMTLERNYPISATASLVSTDQDLTMPIISQWQLGGDLLTMQLDANFSAPYRAKLIGTYSMLRRGLPSDIKITWPTAAWPRDESDPQVFVNDGEFKIYGPGPDYQTNATAKIHGVGIPDAEITLEGKINSHKATFFPMTLQTLGGSLAAEGVFKWHNGLSWNTTLQATELWPDLYWPNLKGLISGTAHFNGRTHNDQTRLELTSINSTGTLYGEDFQLTGDATKDPYGIWHLSAVEMTNKDNQIYANGSVGNDSDLKLIFSSKSIHKFLDDAHGDVHGDLSISGDADKLNVSGSISAAKLKVGEVELYNIKSHGVIRQGGTGLTELTTVAENIVANSQEFHNTRIDVKGSLSEHFIRLAFDHDFIKARQLHLNGSFEKNNDWFGQITDARGLLSNQLIYLRKPFSLRWKQERQSLVLAPHCWTLDHAESCVTKTALVGENGSIQFTVNSLELDNLKTLQDNPLSVTGQLNSTGVLKWGHNREPSVTLQGDITNATATLTDEYNQEKINLQLDKVNINVVTENNHINTDLKIKAKQLGALNVLLDINTSSPSYPVNGSLALASSDLRWLRSYLPDATNLDGQLSADGIIGGNLTTPLINGVVSINNGSLTSASLPVDFEDIALDIEFSNKKSRIIGTARSSDTPVYLSGTSIMEEGSWSSTLNIHADDLELDTEYYRRAVVSPDLNIHITDTGINIDGNLDVHQAKIVVNDLTSGGIATSSDVIIVDASNNEKRQVPTTNHMITSDIDVSLGRRVSFNGYGLKADLRGDFQLIMDAQRPPELLGEIMVDNGTYRSYGQNLLIRDGRLTFIGPLEQTAVTVEAVRRVDNILAGLRVDGSLQNPTTTLFSEPSLPEEEILSYVVLGRSLEFGETDDSEMLTNAAVFMGISNGRNFSKNIAENLGIQDFYLTSTGSGEETQVMLSGRLNNRLLVRYGVGVFNAVNTLFLRYDLAEQLYIETTQGLERAIDIFYSFEF